MTLLVAPWLPQHGCCLTSTPTCSFSKAAAVLYSESMLEFVTTSRYFLFWALLCGACSTHPTIVGAADFIDQASPGCTSTYASCPLRTRHESCAVTIVAAELQQQVLVVPTKPHGCRLCVCSCCTATSAAEGLALCTAAIVLCGCALDLQSVWC